MPRALAAVVRLVRRLVDAHEPRMIGVAARDRMVFELAEMPGEGDMLRAGDVLVAEEQHPVLQKQGLDLGDQGRVAAGYAEVDVLKLGSDRAGELLDADRRAERRRWHDGWSADDRWVGCCCRHGVSSLPGSGAFAKAPLPGVSFVLGPASLAMQARRISLLRAVRETARLSTSPAEGGFQRLAGSGVRC
jgi:hypothetical protein